MNSSKILPPGFISVDEAVELIKSDSKEVPVVDIDYMMAHIKWLEVAHNFRIPKIRKLAPEEQKRDSRGRILAIEQIGSVYVAVNDNFEKELLKKTLNDKYYEFTHREYQELKTRGISTVADDAEGKSAVRPRANKANTKEGDALGNGGEITTNGENLSV